MYGKRGLITGPAELLRTLRATILNGAALYNAEDGEACYKLFVQTAESVIASTRSPTVAEALLKVTVSTHRAKCSKSCGFCVAHSIASLMNSSRCMAKTQMHELVSHVAVVGTVT